MVLFNYSTKELTAKVVYYGPGLCGKTTNLQWIHEKLPIKNKGKMLSLSTETDRTLFFDFLPIELGTIRGMKTRIQLYTVPGQVFYNATRRMVLKGADCVVFVCDSQEPMLEANVESFENLCQNLEANEIDPGEIPMVFQFNKRDLPNALPIEILNERLNPRNLPFYEAVAIRGPGVEETLKGVTGLVFRSLASKYGGADAAASKAAAAAAAGGSPAPATSSPPAAPAGAKSPATAPVVVLPAASIGPASAAVAPAPVAAPANPSPRAPTAAMAAAPPSEPLSPARKPPPASPSPSIRPPSPPASLPPLNIPAAEPADDLLDSLELEPAIEGPEEDLSLRFEPAPDGPALGLGVDEELETFTVEDLPPEPVAPRVDAKTTLVSQAGEAEAFRRKIGRPITPEQSLEDLEEEEIEEISLETETLRGAEPEPAIPAVPAAIAAPEPAPEAPPRESVRARDTLPPFGSASRPAPGGASAIASAEGISTAPVSVELSAPGEAEVTIPVEVSVLGTTARIHIHLQLSLNLKLQG